MQQVDEYVLKAFFVDSSPQDVLRIINSEVHFDFVAAKGYCQVLLDGDLGELAPRQRDKLEKILVCLQRIECFFHAGLDVETERRSWYAPYREPELAQRDVA
jgi:hypothetical protein